MNSSSPRGTTHPWRWLSLPALLLAVACNLLTGTGDLSFDRETEESVLGATPDDSLPEEPPNGVVPAPGEMSECTPGASDCGASAPVPLVPPPPYSACTTDAQCSPPHRCLSGACTNECQSAGDCDGAGARCIRDAATGVLGCARDCDLLHASEPRLGLQQCGAGLRCTFAEAEGEGRTECAAALASGVPGAACQTEADCLTDLSCFRGRCTVSCDPTEVSCPPGQRCGGLTTRAEQQTGICCGVPEGQACNLITDCGCGPGETCSVREGASGATQCRPLPAAPATPYSARCADDASCPALHSCISGLCKRHCNSAADCGSDGVACVATYQGDVPVPGLSFCVRGCDLLSPQQPGVGLRACGADGTCTYFSSLDSADCVASSGGVEGSTCTADRDCAAGSDCIFGTCERWCAPDGSSCGAGQTCSNAFEFGGRQLGRCCDRPTDAECDWATDCGCGTGETCSFSNEAMSCRVVSSTPVSSYAACTSDAQCPVFHECLGGNCMERCSDSSHCRSGARCIPFEGGIPGACSFNCDAVSPEAPAPGFESCASGLTCLVLGDVDNIIASLCYTPGPGTSGDECEGSLDCAAGHFCTENTCRRFCDLALGTCPGGTVCSPTEPALPSLGGRNLGVCLPD